MDTRCLLGHHLVESVFSLLGSKIIPNLFALSFPPLGVRDAMLFYLITVMMWPEEIPLEASKTSEAPRYVSCVSPRKYQFDFSYGGYDYVSPVLLAFFISNIIFSIPRSKSMSV